MIARPTIGFGIGMVLISFFATSNAGISYVRLDSKHCASSKYGAYFSLSTAQSACDSDPNCFGVYDYGCDDSNDFNLCPISESLSDSATGSCVYEKTEETTTTTTTTAVPTTTPMPESCTDQIKNQDEEDIDCGGSSCAACLPEQPEETCADGIKNQDEDDIDCGGACDACEEDSCKNKLPRRLCNGKWRNGKCKKPWVQKRCSATCGHTKPHGCCGNKMNDRRCNRLKPYCKRNWKIANRCEKACGKCK